MTNKLYTMGLFETMCFRVSHNDSYIFVVGKDTAYTVNKINCTGFKDGFNVRDVKFIWPRCKDRHGFFMKYYGR